MNSFIYNEVITNYVFTGITDSICRNQNSCGGVELIIIDLIQAYLELFWFCLKYKASYLFTINEIAPEITPRLYDFSLLLDGLDIHLEKTKL